MTLGIQSSPILSLTKDCKTVISKRLPISVLSYVLGIEMLEKAIRASLSAIVWLFDHSLALPFFGTGMKTGLFQSCGHC